MPLLLLILVALYFLGYIRIPWFTIPRFPLFEFNGRVITFYDLIIFIIAVWAISFLPSPLRQIVGVLFLLWVISTLGILAFAGLSQILLIAIILGIAISLFR